MGNVFTRLFPRADTLIVGNRIGKGGYGEVFRGMLGSRPVAVKKIYDILIEAARENRQTLEHLLGEFRHECDLLKAAKHSNVVEFIGVFNLGEGEESALLVMELMEQTLEQFLRDNRGTLSAEKQIGICMQVVSGLLFLHHHHPQILHRDLTAKNVLMNKEGSIAKISDFGQAKFRPTNIQYLTTRQPGTVLYMPPEALVDKPHFTDKGDIFSLGVLMLQVSTQDPPSCGLVLVKGQPELERRAADLSRLLANHPLRPLILQCLQDDPAKQPSCSEVLCYLLFGPGVDISSVGHNWYCFEQLLPTPKGLKSAQASSRTITNMVSTWTGQDWQQDIPAMPTKRERPGVTTHNAYVIVAGGRAEDKCTLLSSIDVLDTTTRQWYTPANLQLPQPMGNMQITVSATHICVASAVIRYHATTDTVTTSNSAWQLPVSTLTKVLMNEDHSPHDWEEIAPTPHYLSALLQDTTHPLTFGGHDNSYQTTANIAVYDHHSNKWSTVGQLLEPRTVCTVVSLSRCPFLVCGGLSDPRDINTLLSSVEVVSVQ